MPAAFKPFAEGAQGKSERLGTRQSGTSGFRCRFSLWIWWQARVWQRPLFKIGLPERGQRHSSSSFFQRLGLVLVGCEPALPKVLRHSQELIKAERFRSVAVGA
jgi:hypothetical protein